VNALATSKPIEWFEQNLISHVPLPHAGFMRRVYPGFVQLSAFMSMNLERHKQQFRNLYQHLVEGEEEQANVIRVFYDEYLAVNDLPAEFYLETVEKVFQTYDLARGRAGVPRPQGQPWRHPPHGAADGGRRARRHLQRRPDRGRAGPVHRHVRPYLKTHHIQVGVGHYGVFSGRKWNQQIYPRVREVIPRQHGLTTSQGLGASSCSAGQSRM
jgi:poly(3-hydroxybutyrate) depolymerase